MTRRYKCADGTLINLPVEVEARSFEGSKSATELAERYLDPLGLTQDLVFLVDLYPYYLANTAPSVKGRTMAANVKRYEEETGNQTGIKARPKPNAIVALCRTLPGNADRLADHFAQCQPVLVIV
jgi:hypothetical protein